VIPGAVIVGLVGAVASSVAAGAPADLPGLALGSSVLLVAERAFALLAIWMTVVVIVLQAFRHQLPVEISGRGVRYAEAQSVRAIGHRTDDALQEMDADIRWLRRTVAGLLDAETGTDRRKGPDAQ
jgi:hypothetical protein